MAAALLNLPLPAAPARDHRPVVRAKGAGRVCGLTKGSAEDLLDWLEAHGRRGRVLIPVAGEGFTVEYASRRGVTVPGGEWSW
jgi:hypothetical protein